MPACSRAETNPSARPTAAFLLSDHPFQESGNGRDLTRQHQLRGDFGERFDYEAAHVSARMRKNQLRRIPRLVAKRDEIQIKRTRFVVRLFGLPAKFALESLQLRKERFRRFASARNQAHDRVYETWRSGRAIDRFGYVE